MANVIPRKATKLDLTCVLPENRRGGISRHMIASKTDHGWIGTDDNGNDYYLFPAHIRNENIYRVKVVNYSAIE